LSNLKLYSGQRFRKALRHFLWGRVTQAVTYFALMLWLVRALSPSDYGAYMGAACSQSWNTTGQMSATEPNQPSAAGLDFLRQRSGGHHALALVLRIFSSI